MANVDTMVKKIKGMKEALNKIEVSEEKDLAKLQDKKAKAELRLTNAEKSVVALTDEVTLVNNDIMNFSNANTAKKERLVEEIAEIENAIQLEIADMQKRLDDIRSNTASENTQPVEQISEVEGE